MKQSHVKKYFAEWFDHLLPPKQQHEVEEHLQSCRDCRRYYDHLRNLMENPVLSDLPALQPDPFLPTRIKAGEAGKSSPATSWLKWSFATLIILISISLGALLGYTTTGSSVSTDQQLVSEYYQAFSQYDSGYRLETVINLQEENNQ